MALMLVPTTLRAARAFVERNHRHHRPPQGGLFAVAVAHGDQVVGVAIVGRPVARRLADGWTAEVTRVATDGTKNACSMLYGAAWRACRALGYRRLVTYTLPSESGSSLRGAGWACVGEAGGGSWSRGNRPRVDMHPTQVKLRWEAEL
jgi:L-amino acid N-acyltransferase YncA